MVSKYEKAEDYEFAFNAIKNGMQQIVNPVLMSDAAPAIRNGYLKVFDKDSTILMCYAHVKMAVDKRKYASIENKTNIKDDLSFLRLACDEDIFKIGCELFLEKWKTPEPEFVEYFTRYWIQQNKNWYTGACFRTPNTNNSLESFNGSMKIHSTFWKRKSLGEFKVQLLDIVTKRSQEYIMVKAIFQSTINVSKNTMKEGLKYSKIKKVFYKKEDGGKVRCFMLKGDNRSEITEKQVNEFLNTQHKTFDEFKKNMFNMNIVTFNKKNWKSAACSCPAFASNFSCKHVVCIAYQLSLIKPNTKEPVLAANTKRGRPKHASKGLSKD